jgi:hypothetical protein
LQIQTKIVSCHTADSKPVKQEVNGTVILSHLATVAFLAQQKLAFKKISFSKKKKNVKLFLVSQAGKEHW